MKKLQLLPILLLILTSCRGQHDLQIPDHVAVNKDSSTFQFPGTRVFIKKINGYELIQQMVRLQKDEKTFIEIFETPGANFEERKSIVLKSFDSSIKASGRPKDYFQKEFKLGDYDAMLFFGPDPKIGLDQLLLVFGDRDFVVLGMGQVPANDKKSRDEVLGMLTSLYLDKNAKPNSSILANYTVDLSNTEFKLFNNMSQTFIYTIDGKGNLTDPYHNMIMVMSLPGLKDNAALKDFSKSMLEKYRANGIEIPTPTEHDTILNGNYAYEMSFNGSFKGRGNTVYQVATGNQNSSIVLVTTLYDRQAELLPQVKKIAYSLRLK